METDRRPLYLWIAVFLANIALFLAVLGPQIYEPIRLSSISDILIKNSPFFGLSLLTSAVAILISAPKSSKWKLILLLSCIPLFLLLLYITRSVFLLLFLAAISSSSGLVFLAPLPILWVTFFVCLYTLGLYTRKLNKLFILALIAIEFLVIVGTFFMGS